MSETIRLDQITVVAVTMAVFAYLGHQRGILRELVAMPGILLAPVVSPWLSAILVPWVNRFYKLAQFARFGGLTSDDLGAVIEARVCGDLVQGMTGAGLGIGAAVDDQRQPRLDNGPGTHRAGLQRHVQGTILQPPRTQRLRCLGGVQIGRRRAARHGFAHRRRVVGM